MRLRRRARIGVIELYGVLGGGQRAAKYIEMLETLKESQRVKAVLLDIDSPGGSATAANSLYLAISQLAAKKPVVAFISGAGASGAYLAACAATRVIALPHAIVGSIGVISIRPLIPELLHRLGIQMAVTKSGQFKDMGAFYRLPTAEEERKEQELIDQIYQDFVAAVAKSRRLDPEIVKQYATGEVFLAAKAQELKLIDDIGDWEKALDLAAELGKAPRRLLYVRPRRPLMERLLSHLTFSLAQEMEERLESYLLGRLHFR